MWRWLSRSSASPSPGPGRSLTLPRQQELEQADAVTTPQPSSSTLNHDSVPPKKSRLDFFRSRRWRTLSFSRNMSPIPAEEDQEKARVCKVSPKSISQRSASTMTHVSSEAEVDEDSGKTPTNSASNFDVHAPKCQPGEDSNSITTGNDSHPLILGSSRERPRSKAKSKNSRISRKDAKISPKNSSLFHFAKKSHSPETENPEVRLLADSNCYLRV